MYIKLRDIYLFNTPDHTNNVNYEMTHRQVFSTLCSAVHAGMIVLVAIKLGASPSVATYSTEWTANATRPVITDRTSEWNIPLALYVANCVCIAAHVWRYMQENERQAMHYIEEPETTPIAWLHLFITVPLLVMTVAIVSCVRDQSLLFCMFMLNVSAVFCGPISQYTRMHGTRAYNQVHSTNLTWTACVVCFVLITASLTPIWMAVQQSVLQDYVVSLVTVASCIVYAFLLIPVLAVYYDRTMLFEDACYALLNLVLASVVTLVICLRVDHTLL
jgi:hypothetical protein